MIFFYTQTYVYLNSKRRCDVWYPISWRGSSPDRCFWHWQLYEHALYYISVWFTTCFLNWFCPWVFNRTNRLFATSLFELNKNRQHRHRLLHERAHVHTHTHSWRHTLYRQVCMYVSWIHARCWLASRLLIADWYCTAVRRWGGGVFWKNSSRTRLSSRRYFSDTWEIRVIVVRLEKKNANGVLCSKSKITSLRVPFFVPFGKRSSITCRFCTLLVKYNGSVQFLHY